MRVLVLTQQLAAFRSGVGTYGAALVTGLARRGHQVTAVVPVGEEVDLTGVSCLTVPRAGFDPSPGGWRRLAVEFSRAVERLAAEHDVIHFTDAREALGVVPPGKPVVGMVNDSYALDWVATGYPRRLFADRTLRGLYYAYLRRVERRTYRRFSILLANSAQVAETAIEGYALDRDRVRVVHYGLPIMECPEPIVLRGAPAILFVGGNFQRKGLGVLLHALPRVAEQFPGAVVHVVGRDRNQPAMERCAAELGVTQNVVFHGWKPNGTVLEMMAAADVFALPSLTEGFGLAYVEAMRLGTPVIATERSGAREVFQPGVEALFVEPGDVRSLAEALLRLAGDPVQARTLGNSGKAAALKLSVERMAAETEAVYLHLVDGKVAS